MAQLATLVSLRGGRGEFVGLKREAAASLQVFKGQPRHSRCLKVQAVRGATQCNGQAREAN